MSSIAHSHQVNMSPYYDQIAGNYRTATTTNYKIKTYNHDVKGRHLLIENIQPSNCFQQFS